MDGTSIFPRTVDGLDNLELDNITVDGAVQGDLVITEDLHVQQDGLIDGDLNVLGTITGGGAGSGFATVTVTNPTGTTFQVLSTDDSTSTTTGASTMDGGLGVAKALYSASSSTTGIANVGTDLTMGYASKIRLVDAFLPNTNILGVEYDLAGGISKDATYIYTPGPDGGQVAPVAGFNKVQTKIMVATESTSSTSGCLITDGGVGVAKNLHVGGSINGATLSIPGTVTFDDIVADSLTATESVAGGVLITTSNPLTDVNAFSAVVIEVDSGTATLFLNSSTRSADGGVDNCTLRNNVGDLILSSDTASIIISSTVSTSAPVTLTNATSSTTTGTGALVITGGLGVGENLNVSGSIDGGAISGTTLDVSDDITFSTNSDLVMMYASKIRLVDAFLPNANILGVDYDLAGGISKDATYIYTPGPDGGQVAPVAGFNKVQTKIMVATESTTTTDGALVVEGGAGIAKNVNIGGDTTSASFETTTGDVTVGNNADVIIGYGGKFRLNDGFTPNMNILGVEYNPSGGVPGGDGTYIYTPGFDGGRVGAVAGFNKLQTRIMVDADTTSATTGSLVTDGGFGAAKKIHAGDDITSDGDIIGTQFFGGVSGTWTPTIQTGTSITYTVQLGHYYTLGNTTVLTIKITTTSVIDLSALDLFVTGSGITNNANTRALGSCSLSGYAFPTSTDTMQSYVDAADTKIGFVCSRDDLAELLVQTPTTVKSRTITVQITLFS